jgi:hypothetical protein
MYSPQEMHRTNHLQFRSRRTPGRRKVGAAGMRWQFCLRNYTFRPVEGPSHAVCRCCDTERVL